MMWQMASVVILAIILSSCCTTGSAVIPVPDKPDYPKIDRKELVCLSDEAAEKLRDRDVMKSAFINRLIRLIKTTH